MDKQDVFKKFGKRIKAVRLKVGLSQEEAASKSGLDRSYFGAIERGEHNVSLWNICKISRGLDVPIATLFKEFEE